MSDICNPCVSVVCTNAPDVELYNLQNAINFSSGLLSFLVSCPPGYQCAGFPKLFTYPPGTFTVIIPPNPIPGQPIILQLQGCKSNVVRILPAGSSQAAIQAAAQQIVLQVGQQRAECDALVFPPTPNPIPQFFNETVFFVHPCQGDEGLVFTGSLPSWITLDEDNFRLVGAASIFGGAAQTEANATAQSVINAFGNAAVASGALDCGTGFWNSEQTVNCPVGEVGGPFTVPAHTYFSDVDQATADAEALAAAQAQADANCFDCLGNSDTLEGLVWSQSMTQNSTSGNGTLSSSIVAAGAGGTFNMTASVPGGIGLSGASRIIVLSTTLCNPDFFEKNVKLTINPVNFNLQRGSVVWYQDGSQVQIQTLFTKHFTSVGDGLSIVGTEGPFIKTFSIPAHSNTIISVTFDSTVVAQVSAAANGSFHMDGTFTLEFI